MKYLYEYANGTSEDPRLTWELRIRANGDTVYVSPRCATKEDCNKYRLEFENKEKNE